MRLKHYEYKFTDTFANTCTESNLLSLTAYSGTNGAVNNEFFSYVTTGLITFQNRLMFACY